MTEGLSVVVPTYGRRDLVSALLESISADARSVEFDVEVILVDDSSADDAEAIRVAASAHGARVLDSPTDNVGGKRNYGVQQATHDLILFLDSDVVILPGTLQAHFHRLSSCGPDVAGCLGNVRFVGEAVFAWRVIEEMQLTLPFSYPEVADLVPWGPTANLGMRRQPFLAVGGFDTTLPRYGGEDVDLGLRLSDRGFLIITERQAVAEHAIETWSTWGQNLRRLWSFGLADYHLLVRHSSRSFLDFPTGPMVWLAQLMLAFLLLATGKIMMATAGFALLSSIIAYPLVYALVKRKPGAPLLMHVLGPLIFWTMDMAKAVEAVRNRRLDLIVRRLRFLDNLIEQDWQEIAASAWALSASAAMFLCALVIGRVVW